MQETCTNAKLDILDTKVFTSWTIYEKELQVLLVMFLYTVINIVIFHTVLVTCVYTSH